MSQILPSLLEYSPEELTRKCQFLHTNFDSVLKITHNKTLHLHLDFVLPQFAADRSVMAGLSPKSVFEVLDAVFAKNPLHLTIHLMGEIEDMDEMYRFFSQIEIPAYWSSIILVSPRYQQPFASLFETSPHVQIGQWLDLHEWKTEDFQPHTHYLLMTVKAGKSGQKRQLSDRQDVIEIARAHPASFFIFDGGWAVNESVHILNTMIVSYSDFWQRIGYC